MDPLDLLARWGIALVFASVLVDRAGLPIPSPPVLVAAGALAAGGAMRADLALLAALAACLAADQAWFLAGRRMGRRLLAGICRLSISPDTCVRKTDDLIGRHGAALLLVAKFIPGISAVAIPTAAAMGLSTRRFLLFNSLGALAWCGSYVAAGMVFSRQVRTAIASMSEIGGWSLAVLAGLLALYIAWKAVRRARLRRLYSGIRITPEEMLELLRDEPELLVLDARSELARAGDPRRLPRSIAVAHDVALEMLPRDARDRTIVTFCTCPNEASAAVLAERLIRNGHSRVRVLAGGEAALAALAAEMTDS